MSTRRSRRKREALAIRRRNAAAAAGLGTVSVLVVGALLAVPENGPARNRFGCLEIPAERQIVAFDTGATVDPALRPDVSNVLARAYRSLQAEETLQLYRLDATARLAPALVHETCLPSEDTGTSITGPSHVYLDRLKDRHVAALEVVADTLLGDERSAKGDFAQSLEVLANELLPEATQVHDTSRC